MKSKWVHLFDARSQSGVIPVVAVVAVARSRIMLEYALREEGRRRRRDCRAGDTSCDRRAESISHIDVTRTSPMPVVARPGFGVRRNRAYSEPDGQGGTECGG
jgi:hypothetical protein